MQLSAVFLFAATVLAGAQEQPAAAAVTVDPNAPVNQPEQASVPVNQPDQNSVPVNQQEQAKEQSKANLERIKQAASATTEPQTATASEQYITERIVHHSPPHMMIMLQQKHPHVYLEVLKIKERVMVDKEHNVLSKEAVASEQLYRIHRDGSRSTLRSRLFLLSPKTDEEPQQAMSAMSAPEEPEQHDTMDWFDRLALALHLDHFWPRLLFSLSAGFAIVALGFLILHVVGQWLGWHNDNNRLHDNEYAALLNPNFRGPGVVSVHHYHDQIEKSAKMDTI